MSKIKDKFQQYWRSRSVDNIFSLEGAVPLKQAIPLGIQHVLSMFVSNIAPLLIVLTIAKASGEVISNGIQAAILFAAIGTTIQLFPIWKIGSRLPVVVGLSFTFVSILGLVGLQYGLQTMFLSIIIGGIAIGIAGLFAPYWRKGIKPIVSACVVLGIGLSLLTVGIEQFINYGDATLTTETIGGLTSSFYDFSKAWPSLIVAGSALLSSLLFQIFVKGVWKNIHILVGLVTGFLVALCFPGLIDFSSLAISGVRDIVDVPRPIFTLITFQWSDFRIGPIIIVFIVYLVTATEGLGNITSLTSAALGRDPENKEISGGISCDGFVSALSGIFGALPLTTFSQNVGIVSQTKVVNRFTVFQGCLLLYIASFFPIISKLLMSIPAPVMGGCMISLFASIVVIGMQMLSRCGWSKKNITIASLSIGIGYGVTLVPAIYAHTYSSEIINCLLLLFRNPVLNMFLISFIASYAIPSRINDDH